MKTLKEFYNEVLKTDALKKEFLEIIKDHGDLEGFMSKNGCPATIDDLKDFMQDKQTMERELSEEEIEAVAGGTKSPAVRSACNLGLDCDWDEIF